MKYYLATFVKLIFILSLNIIFFGCQIDSFKDENAKKDEINSSNKKTLSEANKTAQTISESIKNIFETSKEQAIRQIEQYSEKYGSTGKKITEDAIKEVEKLFQVEYKVVSFSKDLNDKDIQESLNNLGKERWECLESQSTNDNIRFVCKRSNKSYLRYIAPIIPQMF